MEELTPLYTSIFDTHAHYDDERFDEEREALFTALPSFGVETVLNVGCNLETSRKAAQFARDYGFIYAAAGYHPEQAAEFTEEGLEEIRRLLEEPKVLAIGEIGLDYYWPEPAHEIQQAVLRRQLELALERKLPVILHCRDATEDMLGILRQYPGLRGVVHCFSGSAETAREYLKLGLYIGFTGVLTFKNARKPVEACATVPLDRILLETDCPYLAPVPYRGKRCWSPMIARTAERAAEMKGIPTQALIDHARENGKRLFGIQ